MCTRNVLELAVCKRAPNCLLVGYPSPVRRVQKTPSAFRRFLRFPGSVLSVVQFSVSQTSNTRERGFSIPWRTTPQSNPHWRISGRPWVQIRGSDSSTISSTTSPTISSTTGFKIPNLLRLLQALLPPPGAICPPRYLGASPRPGATWG